MIRLTAKITKNTASQALDSLLEAFEDQQEMNRAAMDAAEPIARAARDTIRRKTGRTGDQITTWTDEEAPQGTFNVFVGIPGPEVSGRGSRAFIGRFLEFGTSKRGSPPWLRPANDTEGGERLMKRFSDIIRERFVRRAAR